MYGLLNMDPPLAVQSYFPHYVFCEEYSSSKIAAECQTSDTKSAYLHCRIIWYAREGLKRLEIVLPIVTHYKVLKQVVMEYGLEHWQIQQAAAKFGMFLKQNLLSPINNATIAYTDSLIATAKDKIEVGGNKIKVKALEADWAEYIVSGSFPQSVLPAQRSFLRQALL
jgi:hypothetical protein